MVTRVKVIKMGYEEKDYWARFDKKKGKWIVYDVDKKPVYEVDAIHVSTARVFPETQMLRTGDVYFKTYKCEVEPYFGSEILVCKSKRVIKR